jgi:hypothetical protein
LFTTTSVQLAHLAEDVLESVTMIATVLVICSVTKEMAMTEFLDVFHSVQVTFQAMITVMTLHAQLI